MAAPSFIYAHNADFFRKDRSKMPFEQAYVIFSEVELSEEEQRRIVDRCMGTGSPMLVTANEHKTRLMCVDSEKNVTVQPLYTFEEATGLLGRCSGSTLAEIKAAQIVKLFSLK